MMCLNQVPLVAGCSLAQLRALVFSPAKVQTFIAAMVADQLKNDYDGINFDLELGGFGKPEETAYSAMLVKLQAALTHARSEDKPVAVVSACVGNQKNGLASPAGVQAAPPGSVQLYDMGLYTSSLVSFEKELLTALEHIKLDHLTVGLSASTDSWKDGAPSHSELQARFKSLAVANVSRVSSCASVRTARRCQFLFSHLYVPSLRRSVFVFETNFATFRIFLKPARAFIMIAMDDIGGTVWANVPPELRTLPPHISAWWLPARCEKWCVTPLMHGG